MPTLEFDHSVVSLLDVLEGQQQQKNNGYPPHSNEMVVLCSRQELLY